MLSMDWLAGSRQHNAFLDYQFGSAVKVPAGKPFPAKYGVFGDYMPDGFVKQQMFPFRRP
jgi:hypothetical protein